MHDAKLFFSSADVALVLTSHASARRPAAQTPGDAIRHLSPGDPEQLFTSFPPEQHQKLMSAVQTFFVLPQQEAEKKEVSSWAADIARLWNAGPQELCFHTSGSTGTPVPQRYQTATLLAEARALAPHFADCTRIITVMPVHHIFGCVFSLLLPKVLGIPVLHHSPLCPRFLSSRRSEAAILCSLFPFSGNRSLRWCNNQVIFAAFLRVYMAFLPLPHANHKLLTRSCHCLSRSPV